ncbi:MAG: ATP-binding protein [Oculatellaceae cyanobacterium bins.114]|nr:ATP-binding protein [Oculatellaceae cyanobacterium bins.114]
MAIKPRTSSPNHSPFLLKRLLGETRTQILMWYVLIILGFILVSLPLIRQRIFSQVDQRVREDLAEEVEEFQGLQEGEFTESDLDAIERVEAIRGMTFTLEPQTPDQVRMLFDVYLSRRVPEDDTFLITLVDGTVYLSSPKALPQALQPGESFLQTVKPLTQPTQGEIQVTEATGGSILYVVEPLQVAGETVGVLIVAHLTAGERQEALVALVRVAEVMAVVGGLVLLSGWWVVGRLLAPLRTLTHTAQQISESDLTARLPIRGGGELADLAQTFNAMMDRLEQAFALQRDFINDAGHELRTPITIIQGNLEVMGDDPDDRRETIALVMDELERMGRLVDDLVLLAKSDRANFLRLSPVEISSLTEELLAKAKALGDRTWQLDAVGEGTITLDRQRITEAVMNLAQNAVQHTSTGNVVAIGSAVQDHCLHLWVRDTGDGVAIEDQTRIFERFARATKTARKSDGSGLGLAIVRAIAEAHHGKITLQSQLQHGSTFTLMLPLQLPFSKLES